MARCKHCKDKFEVKYFNQKYCMKTPECTLAFVSYAKEQKDKSDRKTWSKEKKSLRESLRTRTDHLNELQKVFNKYIRSRDKGNPCISCNGSNKDTKVNAGHYYAVGSYPNLRFNEDNCHLQCEYCNTYLHGSLAEYAPNLAFKIGAEKFEKLSNERNSPLKLTLPEIKELKVYYKKKVKQLE